MNSRHGCQQRQPLFAASSSQEDNNAFEKANKPGTAGTGFNPLKELSDMFNSFDDVIDDFMNKRMGNGEVFYGKRKYRPSGKVNTDGKYNGMGMTDKARIDAARQIKEDLQARRMAWERQQQERKGQ